MKKLRLVTKLSNIEESMTLGETEFRVYRAGNISLALCWDTMESILVVKSATAGGRSETHLVLENFEADVDALISRINCNRYYGKALVAPFLELYI